ncbi:hypothetical protein OI25_7271 [Paraburkholderia fungorum]|jgi:hypothetical protein|uniref:Uncharacterized protein n=1 Tax=Paraburkholderia fungorum TaxID=134537 RepID=A0AAU8SV97_9BURK|nr:hypothetical protein [Paraburkholderia fungorum]AJZ56899.1 hypothetical protein OI25_7271 [Paraburkholderia fungorum]
MNVTHSLFAMLGIAIGLALGLLLLLSLFRISGAFSGASKRDGTPSDEDAGQQLAQAVIRRARRMPGRNN